MTHEEIMLTAEYCPQALVDYFVCEGVPECEAEEIVQSILDNPDDFDWIGEDEEDCDD